MRFTLPPDLREDRDSRVVEAIREGEATAAVAARFDLSVSQVNRLAAVEASPLTDVSKGRPRGFESAQRSQRFRGLVLAGAGFEEAQRDSRVKPTRAFAILDEIFAAPEGRAAFRAMLDELEPAAAAA